MASLIETEKEKFLQLLEIEPNLIISTSSDLRNDPEVVLKALYQAKGGALFKKIETTPKKNKEFILTLIEKYPDALGDKQGYFIDKTLYDDESFMLSLLKSNPKILDYLSGSTIKELESSQTKKQKNADMLFEQFLKTSKEQEKTTKERLAKEFAKLIVEHQDESLKKELIELLMDENFYKLAEV